MNVTGSMGIKFASWRLNIDQRGENATARKGNKRITESENETATNQNHDNQRGREIKS